MRDSAIPQAGKISFYFESAQNQTELSIQLKEKFFLTFEQLHGPGFTAVVLVDNSQGHSAYGSDALLATQVNLNPGGKQPKMRDGWYVRDGQKITQPMVFPPSQPEFPNKPKGAKVVLQERGLWRAGLNL